MHTLIASLRCKCLIYKLLVESRGSTSAGRKITSWLRCDTKFHMERSYQIMLIVIWNHAANKRPPIYMHARDQHVTSIISTEMEHVSMSCEHNLVQHSGTFTCWLLMGVSNNWNRIGTGMWNGMMLALNVEWNDVGTQVIVVILYVYHTNYDCIHTHSNACACCIPMLQLSLRI